MASATTTLDDSLDGADGIPGKRGMSGKKLVLFILLPLLLLGGTVGGLVATGILDFGRSAGEPAEAPPPAPKELVFFALPDLLVHLSPTGRRTNYLKLRVSLEIDKAADQERLQLLAPRIIDNFQGYLRELRVSDLKGSAGMARLREELLRRVAVAVEPIKVNDVLFREMLVQ